MERQDIQPIDFGIITALGEERDSVLRHLDGHESVQEDSAVSTWYRGYVTITGDVQIAAMRLW